MSSIVDPFEIRLFLGGLDKLIVSTRIIKGLIGEPLAELAEMPLYGEGYNLVVDAFVRRDLN